MGEVWPLLVLCLLVPGVFPGEVSSEGLELHLEHSLDEGETFVPRGVVTLHSLQQGPTPASQLEQEPLSEDEMARLHGLCAQDGLYLLRARQTGDDLRRRPEDAPHQTVTDACSLVDSGLRDTLTMHLNLRNQLVGMSISTPHTKLKSAAKGAAAAATASAMSEASEDERAFKTKVRVQSMEVGQHPDTAAFIQKLEQEKLAKQRGETKDNRSFFAKNWMYIVPLVLFLALGGGGGGGGGEGGGGGGSSGGGGGGR